MDVLLITFQKFQSAMGLKSLHYHLLQNSHDSALLYLPAFAPDDDDAMEHIRRFVSEHSPKLIGISLMSIEYHNACRLTEYLKKNFPSIIVVWGGIHPTVAPEMCLGYADYVCIGEGERALNDMLDAVKKGGSIEDVNNLCYKKDGRIQTNPLHTLLDVDEIPSYDYVPVKSFVCDKNGILPIDKKLFKKHVRYSGTGYRTYSIMSSRGCPFSCTYCCNNRVSRLYGTKKVRKRSISSIIYELEKAVKENPEIECVDFIDDCFLAHNNEYLKEFCEIYKKKVARPFMVKGIPTYITRDKLKTLKDSGNLAWFAMGLQSGSDRVCKEIYNRRSLSAQFIDVTGIIKEFDVAAVYDVILDNPFETEEDRLETVQVLTKIPKPYYVTFFSLTFYLGTELYDRAREEFPESVESSLDKDYTICKKDVLNDITRIAPFTSSRRMKKLVDLYKQGPESLRFRFNMSIARWLSSMLCKPLSYFHIVRLSRNGSYIKTFRYLPRFLNEGAKRVFKKFIPAG